jgi:hypothetical protein
MHKLLPEAAPVLADLVRTAGQNPIVEAQIIQFIDDSGRRYDSPIRYVTIHDAEKIARLFPQLSQQRDSQPKGFLLSDDSILVALSYADGKKIQIVVTKNEWAERTDAGDVAKFPLLPTAGKELRERLNTVGRVSTRPTGLKGT